MDREENNCIENNKTGKFYQKTWFLIVAGVTTFIAGFAAGTPGYYETEEVTQVDEQEGVESENKESSVSTPVPIDLTTGTWTCGVDIAPGRYVATVPEGELGNLFIDGSTYVNEVIGDGVGLPYVTFTIEEGDTIEIANTPIIHFEPLQDGESVEDVIEEDAEVEKQTPTPVDLTTGTWTCGIDIAPGRYVVTPEGIGELGIYGSDTGYIAYPLNDGSYDGIYNLNGDEVHGVPSVTCTLEEGDTITISGLQSAHFEPVE